LDGRQSAWLSEPEDYFECEDILLKKS